MKTGGIIVLVFGIFNTFIGLIGLGQYPEQAGSQFGLGIGLIVLGAYLLNRAKNKEEEQDKKEKWNKGEN